MPPRKRARKDRERRDARNFLIRAREREKHPGSRLGTGALLALTEAPAERLHDHGFELRHKPGDLRVGRHGDERVETVMIEPELVRRSAPGEAFGSTTVRCRHGKADRAQAAIAQSMISAVRHNCSNLYQGSLILQNQISKTCEYGARYAIRS